MKKLMFAAVAALAFTAFAEDAATEATSENTEAAPAAESEAEDNGKCPIWGFGSYGLSSGYQLYGSLVNSEPTLQGYAEVNCNLPFGYAGIGVWSNTDLTDKRRYSYGKAFNEWDFNVHWGNTFWFDDEQKYGLFYLTEVVWYYYPHRRHDHMGRSTATTMDWNHYFELKNPYVTPYFKWVHEYHENKANLWIVGLKKAVAVNEKLTITPSVNTVIRSKRYNWCFPTAGFSEFHNGGFATVTLQLDGNYQLTDHFGLFAKVAYCTTVDPDLRDASDHSHGADYGKYKDFAWGQVGMTVNF